MPQLEKLRSCTFVLPCLNEALSLPYVLSTIEKVRCQFEDLEVIVVDNGSHDDSVAVATSFNVRILHCQTRGYGAAIKKGIENSSHDVIVFADADGTYAWGDAVELVEALLTTNSDLVVGNRLKGKIETGAMPFLHRHLGTPALSFLITLLFGLRPFVRVGDCNGGMRALKKQAYHLWNLQSSGMEFASEMIVRALQTGSIYHEVPIKYRRGLPGRHAHLRTWRDGFRHFKQILFLFLYRFKTPQNPSN